MSILTRYINIRDIAGKNRFLEEGGKEARKSYQGPFYVAYNICDINMHIYIYACT